MFASFLNGHFLWPAVFGSDFILYSHGECTYCVPRASYEGSVVEASTDFVGVEFSSCWYDIFSSDWRRNLRQNGQKSKHTQGCLSLSRLPVILFRVSALITGKDYVAPSQSGEREVEDCDAQTTRQCFASGNKNSIGAVRGPNTSEWFCYILCIRNGKAEEKDLL